MAENTYRIHESGQVVTKTKVPSSWETLTVHEARGICWMFEEPRFNAQYIIGVDPAFGITGWDRHIIQDDQENDNSAVEVFRLGRREVSVTDADGKTTTSLIPTAVQVAEYAAPVDYARTAEIVNILGRLYKGTGAMGVAHTIIEVYPGNGWMIEKELISKYGYMNFYQPKYINTLMPQTAKGIGWQASTKSVRDLWIMGTRKITNRDVIIRSPWLLNEMETTEPIKFLSYSSEAKSGFHDDRLRAAMLALWAMFDFSSQIRPQTETTVEHNKKAANWQASDLSADSLKDEWNKRLWEISES